MPVGIPIEAIKRMFMQGGDPASMLQPDPSQTSATPPVAPTAGAISQGLQPQAPPPDPMAAQPQPAPSLDGFVAQHGHAPIEGAPPPVPEHGTLYKVFNTLGRVVGSPIAERAYNHDWDLKQQNIAYQRQQPVMQDQADRAAFEHSLGEQKTGGEIAHTAAETKNLNENLPAWEKATNVHNELAQRWQSNTDPDEASFQQFAEDRLAAEPPSVQRRLMGDPAHGIPSPLQGITKLPRQPFTFKVSEGAIVPGTYRGVNYGPNPSPNEPAEVTAARNNALASIKQGQTGKVAVAKAEGQARAAIQAGNFGQAGDPMVDMVGQGRVDLATALQRVPPQAKEAFMTSLSAKYPGYQQSTYGIAKNVGEAFTAGDQGKQLTAISTAREHMKTFQQLADALDNSDVQLANRIGNALGVQFGEDKATNFKIAAQAFGGEVGKAFDGAGVTEGERKSAQAAFNPNMSPKQFRGALQTVDALLSGKQKALKDAYDAGSQGKPNFGTQPSVKPGGSAEGPTATGPNGHKIKVVGGKWVDAATGQPIQ